MLRSSIVAAFANVVIFLSAFGISYMLLRRIQRGVLAAWLVASVIGILCVASLHPTRAMLDELPIGLEAADPSAGSTPRPLTAVRPEIFNGQATDLQAPEKMAPGSLSIGRVTLHNASEFRWPTHGEFAVLAGYRFFDQFGIVRAEGRSRLFPDIAPRETRIVDLSIVSPQKAGVYTLEAGALLEGIAWFETNGGALAKKEVIVQ